MIESIRQCRPLSGKGIYLQETPSGTIISAIPSATNTVSELSYRFRTDIRSVGTAPNQSYELTVSLGSLYEVLDDVATEKTLALSGLTLSGAHWIATGMTAGQGIYIAVSSTGQYTLTAGAIPADPFVIIATIGNRYDYERPFILQRVLGDIYAFKNKTKLPDKNLLASGAEAILKVIKKVPADPYNPGSPSKIQLTLPIYNMAPAEGTTPPPSMTLEAIATDLESGGADLPAPTTINVVTAVSYDTTTHKLTMTTQSMSVYLAAAPSAPATVDITTAVAHSTQH
ncbi:MAG: hypothetical protein RR996_01805 [Alistipes sp.]